MELPDRVKALPAPLRATWEKAYKMALDRFANDTGKAEKVADKAVARAKAKTGKAAGSGSAAGEGAADPWEIRTEISKVDESQGLVFGWAYVSEKSGEVVTDHSGEHVSIGELEKAFYDYALNSRAGGEMHVRKASDGEHPVATLVESIVFTAEKLEAMGLPEGTPLGAWVGYKVWDEGVLAKIRSGEYAMLSIGGSGKRKAYEKSALPETPVPGTPSVQLSAAPAVMELERAVRKEISEAGSYDELSDGARAYLSVVGAAMATEALEKGKGPNRHGPSIKCPDIYEALRREGHTKTSAAKISNECYSSPRCNCH